MFERENGNAEKMFARKKSANKQNGKFVKKCMCCIK